MIQDDGLSVDKAQARKQSRAARDNAFDGSPEKRHEAEQAMARHFLEKYPPKAGDVLGFYHPIQSEANPLPIAQAYLQNNAYTCLPRTTPNLPLSFHDYGGHEDLEKTNYGTFSPSPYSLQLIPSIFLVPLLSYDDDFYRLGFGGGFYDRTIAHLRRAMASRPLFIGIGFSQQKVASVPRGIYDCRLDAMLTEQGLTFAPKD